MIRSTFIYDGDTVTQYGADGKLGVVQSQDNIFDNILEAMDITVFTAAEYLEAQFNSDLPVDFIVYDLYSKNENQATVFVSYEDAGTVTSDEEEELAQVLNVALIKGIAFDEDGDAYKNLSDVLTFS